jgi:plastocyanin
VDGVPATPNRHAGTSFAAVSGADLEGNAMKHRIGRTTSIVTVALLAMALIAVAAAPTVASAATKRVTISNFSFSPQTITIKHGTKVVWKNSDSTQHTVTSASDMSTSASVTGLFASPTLSPGSSFSFTFKKKGTYFYECTIHASMASMHGKVVVK